MQVAAISTNSTAFGMKHIDSLRAWAKRNPDKRVDINPEDLKKANEAIREALKNSKKERIDAEESAKKILLTV